MDSLEELLTEEIRDLYDAEKQLVRALPKFSKAATSPDLKAAFNEHLEVTRGQVRRLEQIFELLGQKPKGKPCKAMKGLLEEGQEILGEDGEDLVLDEAMIGAAQKVEHYEIAGYGTARTLASNLGLKDIAKLLQETLNEEGAADKKLTAVAINLWKASKGKPPKNGAGQSKTNAAKPGRSNQKTGSKAVTTTDHNEIQAWAEARRATPACVRGTGAKGDTGVLRFDFPGYSGADSLEPVEWEEFFEKFDEQNLALLYQPQTAGGAKSNFNKLVARTGGAAPAKKAKSRKR